MTNPYTMFDDVYNCTLAQLESNAPIFLHNLMKIQRKQLKVA